MAVKKKSEENQAVTVVDKELPKVNKVAFESWFYSKKNIPKHHAKEIIFADFKARGLTGEETMEAYDKALYLYGIR